MKTVQIVDDSVFVGIKRSKFSKNSKIKFRENPLWNILQNWVGSTREDCFSPYKLFFYLQVAFRKPRNPSLFLCFSFNLKLLTYTYHIKAIGTLTVLMFHIFALHIAPLIWFSQIRFKSFHGLPEYLSWFLFITFQFLYIWQNNKLIVYLDVFSKITAQMLRLNNRNAMIFRCHSEQTMWQR